jgi:hypothetical protein
LVLHLRMNLRDSVAHFRDTVSDFHITDADTAKTYHRSVILRYALDERLYLAKRVSFDRVLVRYNYPKKPQHCRGFFRHHLKICQTLSGIFYSVIGTTKRPSQLIKLQSDTTAHQNSHCWTHFATLRKPSEWIH